MSPEKSQSRTFRRRLRTGLASLCAAGLLAALLAFAYIRLAPPYIDHAHQPPHARGPGDYEFPAGHQAVRRIEGLDEDWLGRADAVILATPRTRSLSDKSRLYETRSRFWGFPDYTSLWIEAGEPSLLVIRSTARFGDYDFGVNRARIDTWLKTLGLDAVEQ